MALRKSDSADMRKRYPIYIEVGLIATLIVLIAAFRLNFQAESDFQAVVSEQETVQMEEVQQTQQQTQPPPPPKPPVPVEVPNDQVLEEEDVDFDSSLDFDESLSQPEAPPPPPEEPEGEAEPEVFMVVENDPELIGGLAGLQKQVEYPEFARKAGIEGRVFVQFIVDENGNVTQPTVLRSPHKLLSEEAMRVIREAKFKPGKQRGKAVKVKMSLPVTFALR